MTSSTVSSESAPRSSTKEAFGVTSPSSTPSCSTIICFTFSSTAAMLLLFRLKFLRRAVSGAESLLGHFGIFLDVGDRILNCRDLLRFFVGNLDIESFFKGHDQFNSVQ